MRIFISYTIISFFLDSAVFSDEKPGRNFVDLPDIDDGYNIHVMYVLPKDGIDKDYDLDSKISMLMYQSINGLTQKLKIDYLQMVKILNLIVKMIIK